MFKELNSQVPIKKNGFYQVEKDTEALSEYLKYIDDNSLQINGIEKFQYIISLDLYENRILNDFTEEEINYIFNVYNDLNFEFKSFMSAFKFYNDYALKDPKTGTILENFKDRCLAVSLSLFDDIQKVEQFFRILVNQEYQPATPSFLNLGKRFKGENISCFLLDTHDNLDSIVSSIGDSMKLSKIGGGVAVNLSNLRGKGEPVNNNPNSCKGVVPVMKILEDSFNYADQMGQRKGAGAVYLNIFHSDIIDFLDTKKINADEKSRIQTLSTGVIIPDLFFDLVRNGDKIYLFSSYNLTKNGYADGDFPNITKELYDQLILDPNVEKRSVDARKLLLDIAKLQFESGYPYLIFIDNANRSHCNIGNIKMSNLCTEIFQAQFSGSECAVKKNNVTVDIDKEYNISCVLGSLNIVNVMNNISNFENIVKSVVCSLSIIAKRYPKYVDSIYNSNNDFRSIGIGAMNLYGFFVKNYISYESDEALEFCNIFFMLLNYFSLKASCELAKIYSSYYGFKASDYANGSYFDRYKENIVYRDDIKSDKIKNLFNDAFIPLESDWQNLKLDIQKYGLYNAYRLTIAPTQSISYLQNSTPSIFPPTDLIESRVYGNSTTYFPAPFLNSSNQSFYRTSYTIDIYKMIDLVAEVQKHVDQGISTTLFIDSNTSTKELMKYYIYAHKKGLKSLYYTRTKNLKIEECESCAV